MFKLFEYVRKVCKTEFTEFLSDMEKDIGDEITYDQINDYFSSEFLTMENLVLI